MATDQHQFDAHPDDGGQPIVGDLPGDAELRSGGPILDEMAFAEDFEAKRTELLKGALRLARDARRMTIQRAITLCVSVAILSLLILIVIDAFLQREETGLRLLALTLWIGGIAFAIHQWLLPALKFTPGLQDVATWMAGRGTEAAELSTMIQLAATRSDDPRYGSPHFRQFTLSNWMNQGKRVGWSEFLDYASLRRVSYWCFGVILVALIGTLVWPQQIGIGAQRILLPWSAASWPRADELELVDLPKAVAYGSDLQIEIRDRNPPLPQQIQLYVRDADRRSMSDANEGIRLSANTLGELAIANLSRLERAVQVRAVGGDDESMPWHRIDVVQPPTIDDYRFTILPPKYTRLSKREVQSTTVQAWEGSSIGFHGRFSEPVMEARIIWHDKEMLRSSQLPSAKTQARLLPSLPASSLAIRLASDGRTFDLLDNQNITWRLTESLAWRFEVTTLDGLSIVLPDTWSIEVKPDLPPQLEFREPNLYQVTRDAKLPLQGKASDDLGLVAVSLHVQPDTPNIDQQAAAIGDQQIGVNNDQNPREHISSSEITRILWTESKLKLPNTSETSSESVTGTRLLNIADLLTVADLDMAGEQFDVWLQAEDGLGQVGTSRRITFQISGASEVQALLQAKQSQLLDQLSEVADAQRRNRELARNASESTNGQKKLRSETVSALSNVVQMQSTIDKRIHNESTGILARAQDIESSARMNGLPTRPDLTKLRERLEKSVQEKLSDALRKAQLASRSAREQVDAAESEITDALSAAVQQSSDAQETVLRDLNSLLSELSQAEANENLLSGLVDVLRSQEALLEDSEGLHLQAIRENQIDETRSWANSLASEQLSLSQGLDDLKGRIREQLQQQTVTTGENWTTVLETLEQTQVGQGMRRSATDLRSSRIAQSITTQGNVLEGLRSALKQAGWRSSENEFADRAERMQQAGQRLRQLASQQSELAQTLGSQTSIDAEQRLALSDRQNELLDAAREQTQELQSTGASAALRTLETAIEAQQSTAEQLQSEQPDPLSETMLRNAQQEAQLAADRLRESAEAAAMQSSQLEKEAQQKEAFELIDSLQQLVAQQQSIVESIQTLGESNSLAQQTEDANEIAAAAEAVRQDVENVLEMIPRLPAFVWVLEQSQQDMQRSIAAVQRLRIPESLTSAENALNKLNLAADALAEAAPNGPSDENENNNSSAGQDEETQESKTPAVASLRLLRALQFDLQRRTKQVEEQPRTNQRKRSLQELSIEQQELVRQLERFVEELAESEDSPAQDYPVQDYSVQDSQVEESQ